VVERETLRVLVVDMDAGVRSVVEDLLFDRGFEVRQAANQEFAVLELRQRVFDVLLCHLSLLRSAPLQRCAQELRPTLWITAMSASGARARREEADANLAKPFTRLELVTSLRPL